MSILNVENLTHGFGDRAIFNNVSFRLLKGVGWCQWGRKIYLHEHCYR